MDISTSNPSCYCQLRQLRAVSSSLSRNAVCTLVHVFVTSQLDYCCSVLVGLSLTLTANFIESFARLPKFRRLLKGCLEKIANPSWEHL